jgi:hypothetical protein
VDQIALALQTAGPIALMVGFLLAPVAVIVGLLWAARRRILGRRSRFDGLFTGMARANSARNELVAGIPRQPDVPPRPTRRKRR